MPDLYVILSVLAAVFSALSLLSRMSDKSLSIREHEAYKEAAARDIHRVETRLSQIEQSRPTTGELQILAESFNKRLDELKKAV